MSLRKILALVALAGIAGSSAACSDITGPQQSQQTGFCAVTGGGQTCTN
jgi:hypothetical protein